MKTSISATRTPVRPSSRPRAYGRRESIALAAAAVLAAIAAPHLFGRPDPRVSPALAAAVAVAAVLVFVGPQAAQKLSWSLLLVCVVGASIAWAVTLAAGDGLQALSAPVVMRSEYWTTAQSLTSPTGFVAGFVDQIDNYPVHVRGHPPGMVLVLWTFGRIGLSGPGWAAALMIGVGGTAAAAVLVAAREMAGEATARAAAPFLVLLPAAVWIATSADALFMGVAAWGVALVVLATGRTSANSDAMALAGGVVLAAALFLTYGAVLLLVIPVVVSIARRRVRPLLVAAAGASAVVVAFALTGFWWLAGLAATRREYFEGIASRRGYWLFLFANLGALAIAIGPAAVAGLARLRDRGLVLLVGGAIGAVVIADISGMSKAETERIWLLFVPWLVLATADLASRTGVPNLRASRAWLASSAATGLAVQALHRSPW